MARAAPDLPGHPGDPARGACSDVYDLPVAAQPARRVDRRRRIAARRDAARPAVALCARSLLFGYVGANSSTRAIRPSPSAAPAALSLDPALLGELLGTVELRELLDPEVIAQFEREAQRLDPERRARGLEGVADLLRLLGPLDAAEVAARLTPPRTRKPRSSSERQPDSPVVERAKRDETPPPPVFPEAQAHLDALVAARRAIPVMIAGMQRIAAIEDAGRLRHALGAALPTGIPVAFLEPVADPLGDLVARHARTHGPFTTDAVATRFGIGAAVARHTLQRLENAGRVTSGYFLPSAAGTGDDLEWCDTEVLRTGCGCGRSRRSAGASSRCLPRRTPASSRTGSTSTGRSRGSTACSP